jgi:hypothetical protein
MFNLKQLKLIWIFVGLLCVGSSSFAASGSVCQDLFSSRATSIDQWLHQAGLNTIAPQKQNWRQRWREDSLFNRLNPVELSQTKYRNWWVDQIVDLKISQQLKPLDDYELISRKSSRDAIKRLAIRSAVQHGLESYLERNEGLNKASVKSRLLSVVRWLTFIPEFRFLITMQFPADRIVLSDKQLYTLISGGLDGVNSDPELRKLIDLNGRDQSLIQLNRVSAALIMTSLTLSACLSHYPAMEKNVDTALANWHSASNRKFIGSVTDATNIQAQNKLLGLTQVEKKIMVDDFQQKYHDSPTAGEDAKMNSYICKTRYGNALEPAAIVKCMAM